MKKLYLGLLMAAAPLLAIAQCTPDLSIVNNGVYPKVLSNGLEGQPYSQVMQFKIPKDTMGATVDSLYVLSITGGPSSLTYQCNNPGCGYKGNTIGCALLSANLPMGSAGNYTLTVTVKVRLRIFTVVSYQTFTNTLDFTVDQATGAKELWNQWRNSKTTVYPNPFTSAVHLKFPSLRSQTSEVTFYDLMGRVIAVKPIAVKPGVNDITLDMEGLQTGVYLMRFMADGKAWQAKVACVN